MPALWVDVPASCTLPDLHDVLQVAVGRTDSHLHQFVAEEASYGVPDRDGWQGQRDEAGVRLTDLPGRFIYVYDFGDGWGYKVEVLGSGGGQPGCVHGGDAARRRTAAGRTGTPSCCGRSLIPSTWTTTAAAGLHPTQGGCCGPPLPPRIMIFHPDCRRPPR